jgi:nicotinamidase-related amidase
MAPLPLPPHFDPTRVGEVYRVPYEPRAQEARAWAREHGLDPASRDTRRVGLLLVDVQNTFCQPDGELFVAGRGGRGAVLDNVRLCEFVYRNLGRITRVVVTLDTHMAAQVFHPLFWVDAQGDPPAPYTVITAADVDAGRYRVNPELPSSLGLADGAEREAFARHYVGELARGGRFPLTVWPYHAMLGGIGHALVPAVEEAVFFQSVARSAPARFEVKGSHALTEHFSALRPEVESDHRQRRTGGLARDLVEELLGFDLLFVAGQAKSHCVAWTVEDLLREIRARDPRLARRVCLLEDCSSPVVVPGVVDWSDAAETAYARFAEAGMHRIRAGDVPESWPEPGA